MSATAAAQIAKAAGQVHVRDASATLAWVEQALAANAQAVADAKGNPKRKRAAIGFLRGQVMKISGGKADPKMVGELIEKRLGE